MNFSSLIVVLSIVFHTFHQYLMVIFTAKYSNLLFLFVPMQRVPVFLMLICKFYFKVTGVHLQKWIGIYAAPQVLNFTLYRNAQLLDPVTKCKHTFSLFPAHFYRKRGKKNFVIHISKLFCTWITIGYKVYSKNYYV